eukprot:UN13337
MIQKAYEDPSSKFMFGTK